MDITLYIHQESVAIIARARDNERDSDVDIADNGDLNAIESIPETIVEIKDISETT
jgi:hypothetical protein